MNKTFQLEETLRSGQIFRWEKIIDWIYVTVGNNIVKIKQLNGEIDISSLNNFDHNTFFDLNNPSYDEIIELLTLKLGTSVKKYEGLRLIKQQPWECTASFICSSNSNIKRITQNVNSIAKEYGHKIEFEKYKSYTFPEAKTIASQPQKLKNCRLGYREKYLIETSRMVARGFDFKSLRKLKYSEAKIKLMHLPGVGPKVADCILLFSLGFSEAFPTDVWIEREMQRLFFKGKSTHDQIQEKAKELFGNHRGYAQQFIYHISRNR